MTLLNTTLQIVRGVFKAPGDAFSAENDLFILELQDPAGFSLQVDGWSPNLPALKGGGTWAESAIADGRIPLAQSVGNVTETMRLTMGNGDLQQRFAIFRKLQLMRQSVIDFWDGMAQIDPVYIRWHAAIGKGEQFALIYNLEMAQDTDIFNPEQAWDVTITIERESYWRGIWPGSNPLEWRFQAQGKVRGSGQPNGYDINDLTLVENTDHLVSETINNKHEWVGTTEGNQTSYLTKNYIEIAESAIPGDAPALVQLAIRPVLTVGAESVSAGRIYIALSSKEVDKNDHTNTRRVQAYTLNGGDASTIQNATVVNGASTTGIISGGSSSVYKYVDFALPASIGGTGAIAWGRQFVGANFIKLDRELLRGVFMVFARGTVTTGGAAAGDVSLRLGIAEDEGALNSLQVLQSLPSVNASIVAQLYPLTYLGRIQIPFNGRSTVSLKGYGRQVHETLSNMYIELDAINNVASARNYRLTDLIFLPLDEGIVELDMGGINQTGTKSSAMYVLDGTGYLSRGTSEMIGRGYMDTDESDAITGGVNVEVRGELMLTPSRRQRLYFLATADVNPSAALVDATMSIRLNIVPRWAGIRDV